MLKSVLIGLALAAAAAPARAQDVPAMSASQYIDADVTRQFTLNGYVIAHYRAATDADSPEITACVENWLARPSGDGLWGLSEKMRDGVTIAAFGSEGATPVLVVLRRAILDACR